MFRYFQCEAKHGIFAQVGKVRKHTSTTSSTQPKVPPTTTPSLPKPRLPSQAYSAPKETPTRNSLSESNDVNEALKAMEVCCLILIVFSKRFK